jgi:transposase
MVLADGQGIPLGISVHSASPAEVTLVEETLSTVSTGTPERLIADKAYDSAALRERLSDAGIEQITPHKSNRVQARLQDGRALRRYKRRWKIERSIAWLGNFRRLLIRWERYPEIYRAFVHLACILITLRHL